MWFCRDVLGLKEVARATFDRPMAFFFRRPGEITTTFGLFEIGPDAASPSKNHVGLYHVALRIGHSLEALRGAKAHLVANDEQELRLRDHTVSQSIYLNDPDGNGLELYVDADPGIWRDDPAAVATSVPLEL